MSMFKNFFGILSLNSSSSFNTSLPNEQKTFNDVVPDQVTEAYHNAENKISQYDSVTVFGMRLFLGAVATAAISFDNIRKKVIDTSYIGLAMFTIKYFWDSYGYSIQSISSQVSSLDPKTIG